MKKKFGLTLAAVLLFVLASWGWIIYQLSPDTPEAMTVERTEQVDENINNSSEENEDESSSEQEEANKKDSSLNADVKAAVAAVVQNTRDLFVRPDLKMVAIGDSLTQGVGDESGNGGYVGILEEIMEDSSSTPSFEIKNYGKKGNRTDQLIKRMEDPEISSSLKEADIIFITIGANDIMKVMKSNFNQLTYEVFESETDDYKERMEQIFQSIRSKNEEATIYLVGIFNPFQMYFNDIPELNRIIADWNQIGQETAAKDENATFVPMHGLFHQADNTYYAEDNFHPNQRGYALIAKQVFRYLEPELEQNSRMVRQHDDEQD